MILQLGKQASKQTLQILRALSWHIVHLQNLHSRHIEAEAAEERGQGVDRDGAVGDPHAGDAAQGRQGGHQAHQGARGDGVARATRSILILAI